MNLKYHIAAGHPLTVQLEGGHLTQVRAVTDYGFVLIRCEDHPTMKIAESRASALAAAIHGDRDEWEYT